MVPSNSASMVRWSLRQTGSRLQIKQQVILYLVELRDPDIWVRLVLLTQITREQTYMSYISCIWCIWQYSYRSCAIIKSHSHPQIFYTKTIDQSDKSYNAPVPYLTIHYSEQEWAHFCSEWCITWGRCICGFVILIYSFRTDISHPNKYKSKLWGIGTK